MGSINSEKIVWIASFLGYNTDYIPSAVFWLESKGLPLPDKKYMDTVKSVALGSGSVSDFLNTLRNEYKVLSPFIKDKFLSNYNNLVYKDSGIKKDSFIYEPGKYNEKLVRLLLEELGNYRELEVFSKVSLQLQGIWP